MLVTLFGITMLVKLPQLSNAAAPMFVTLSGIVMLVKLLHSENAQFPMLVTPSSITTFLTLEFMYAGLKLSVLL